MPLIVEDGSIVANANSYVDFAMIREFATARGLAVADADDDVLEPLAILAMDYLNVQNWKGTRVDKATQELDWPRADVYVDGDELANDEIPPEVQHAQIWLIHYANEDVKLWVEPNNDFSTVGLVTQKTVGPLTKKFSDKVVSSWHTANADGTNKIPQVAALLSHLIQSFMPLRNIRI